MRRSLPLIVAVAAACCNRAGTTEGFIVTVSGESLSVNGYDFTPMSMAADPAFVDGWELRFDHVIVTVANIRIHEDPDKNTADPTDLGAIVAHDMGSYAVDAHIGGPLTGKSGAPDEKTVEITRFPNTGRFDASTRYAFSYDFAAPTASTKEVNLDAAGKALLGEAKTNGWVMIFQGTATYKGAPPAANTTFAKMPGAVKFTIGLTNPASYINCRNTDLPQVAMEHPRGIQASQDEPTTVQITLHTDHVFWNGINVEGTPLHFDPIAAQASTYGMMAASGDVLNADLDKADFTGFKSRTPPGDVLAARSLVSDYAPPNGQLNYDPNGTAFAKSGSYLSYLAYAASSGGHLNEDGECVVKLNFTP